MPSPRQVAVAIILASSSLSGEPSFLLASSRKHAGRFCFAGKGGIEEGEDAKMAAEREAWEEAGISLGSAMHLDHLVFLPDVQPHKKSPSTDPSAADFIPSTTYSFELFVVPGSAAEMAAALADEWPEKAERERKWVKGWDALEESVAWGRRKGVMSEAVAAAKARYSA